MADDDLVEYPAHPPIDGALMVSFGAVQTGREALAVDLFTELQNVRVHTVVAGSQAGRLVRLYGEVRSELGLI